MTKILVVEDEASFSDALEYLLSKEGFEVSVADTGDKAISTFDKVGADLVCILFLCQSHLFVFFYLSASPICLYSLSLSVPSVCILLSLCQSHLKKVRIIVGKLI